MIALPLLCTVNNYGWENEVGNFEVFNKQEEIP